MAGFNEIQVGRINRYVQKLLAVKGTPPTPTVASDLQFIHQIDTGQENRYLQGWDLFAFSKIITASAANQSAIEIRNPKGSNVLAVLTRAVMFNTAAVDNAALNYSRVTTVDQPNTNTVRSFDNRGRNSSTVICSDDNAAAFSAIGNLLIILQFSLPQNSVGDFIRGPADEVPLLPGDALLLASNNANQTCSFSLWWRERFLEDSERS